jgi:2-iminoacetate synthase
VSFVAEFNTLPLRALVKQSLATSTAAAREAAGKSRLSLADFAALISPAGSEILETLGRRAHTMTQQRFGKVIRLFAPLYLSNECINNCTYCGFSRDNSILRVTLSLDEVKREAEALKAHGFRNLLLVAGEHPKFVSNGYLRDCIAALHPDWPSIGLEVAPMEAEDYRPLVAAGADGLTVYQETYDREVYARMHTAGPKRDFEWRMETPERAYAAGFRRLGISPLYGLADWRFEALSAAAHADYLLRNCWKAALTISTVRIRPSAGEFAPISNISDRELVQLICSLRLMFPDVGIVLSTRETPKMRDGLISIGVTVMSAGARTEPGGYTGAGREKIHHTEHGIIKELASGASEWAPQEGHPTNATGQFNVGDERRPQEIAELIRKHGYEPVWKDWDAALTA